MSILTRVGRWAQRVGQLAAFVETLASDAANDDPLAEDPFYILTAPEMASLRARREEVSDVRARSDLALLLATVDRLGGRLVAAHRGLDAAYQVAREADTPQALVALADRVAEVVSDLARGTEVETPSPSRASITTWLALPWDKPLPFPPDDNPITDVAAPTALHVLAALVGMNGGIETKLVVPTPGGPYGRLGLHPLEAGLLVELIHFCNGWITATGEDPGAFYQTIGDEVARRATLRSQARRVAPASEEAPSDLRPDLDDGGLYGGPAA